MDDLDIQIFLASEHSNLKFYLDKAIHEKEKAIRALKESIVLLESAIHIKPEDTPSYKIKIDYFKKLIDSIK